MIHLIIADISFKKKQLLVQTTDIKTDTQSPLTPTKKQKTKFVQTQVLRLSPPAHIQTPQPARKAQLAKNTTNKRCI